MLGILRRSYLTGHPVEIIYISGKGEVTQRWIEILKLNGSSIEAYCHLRRKRRIFLLENILSARQQKQIS